MDMISKSKLIHGTIAATMALSMTILPIAPASAEETVSAPESDYTGWVTQDGEYYWFDSGIMACSKEIYDPGSEVVPEKLRTLDHGRPWSDDQFASTRLSSNRDMSR